MQDLISLGMIVRQEEEMLRLTLPLLSGLFRNKVAVLFPSTDASHALLDGFGFTVVQLPWPGSYAEARNQLVAASRTYSTAHWSLMLDADEALFPEDVQKMLVAACSTRQPIIGLPRYNLSIRGDEPLEAALAGRRILWEEGSFPDTQLRLYQVDTTITFRNVVHECPYPMGSDKGYHTLGRWENLPDAPIYHYGACKPLRTTWLRHHNYRLLADGKPLLTECPFSQEELLHLCHRELLPLFTRPHPLEKHHA